MPTQVYNDFEEAYRALTDEELENDERDIPCAVIKQKGLPRVVVQQVCEWDYFNVLIPLRDRVLNYYVNRLAQTDDTVDIKKLTEKVKNLTEELSGISDKEKLIRKSKTMAYMFEDAVVREEFFLSLKKMKVIGWWVSWERWQRKIRPLHTITIFVFLWRFNFDGLKKKVLTLLRKTNTISQDTSSPSHIVLRSSKDWERYKRRLAEGSARVTALLASQTNSNN